MQWLARAASSSALLLCHASPAQAAGEPNTSAKTLRVYKYEQNGTPSFSDRPPVSGVYTILRPSCFACSPSSPINWKATKLYFQEYAEPIERAARDFGVETALLRAVVHAESGFNPHARSGKGAMGLMQLMPSTARDLGVLDAMDPGHNIRGGAQYLANLLQRFRGDVSLATAAYNAGPQAVQKYAGIPPFAETQVYVQRVKILHQRYREGHL